MPDRPIERWKSLRLAGGGDGELEVPSLSSGVETGYGPARFALGPQGQPRLLVPCGPGAKLSSTETSKKLTIALSRFTAEHRASNFVDVMSVDRRLDPVFAELANEILHRLGMGNGPVAAVEGTISDFRELLREEGLEEVPDSLIYGLLGELVVLRSLAARSSDAIDAWTGPYEQRHDFRRREHALEVKTSARADATTIWITSCDQLAEPSGGTVSLIHVRMERSDGGPLRVSTLVREILERGVQRPALERGLAAAGCLDPDSEEWNRIQCNLEGLAVYRVEEGFPRITSAMFASGSLPVGMVEVSYSIDLGAAQQYRLSECEADYILTRIVR